MNAENQKAERVLKLLLESFPEHPRSERSRSPLATENLEGAESPLLVALAHEPLEHGIRELTSPLSE